MLYCSLTSALDGVDGQWYALAALFRGNKTDTYCIGGWVDPRADLNRFKKCHPHRDSIHTNIYIYIYIFTFLPCILIISKFYLFTK